VRLWGLVPESSFVILVLCTLVGICPDLTEAGLLRTLDCSIVVGMRRDEVCGRSKRAKPYIYFFKRLGRFLLMVML